MIYKPSWVTVYYHTKSGQKKHKQWMSSNVKTGLHFQKAVLQNMTIEEAAFLYMPRGCMFDVDNGDRLVFCFNMIADKHSPYHDRFTAVSTCGFIHQPLGSGFKIPAFKVTDRMESIINTVAKYWKSIHN